ncbi:MAG: multicopper oxidase domain-containing protein [Saprospiraceae bacterium]|nr:multicopper oxidase domain-containing protein [Saprospiraceae bacterium]
MERIIFILAAIIPSMGFGQNPLFVPDPLSGKSFSLSLQNGQVEFYPGFNTHTIGYNQDILGPTLILEKGSNITFNVTNNLSEQTTLHWHGLHVPAADDGSPHTIIEPGQLWSPSFTILDKSATYWYHPHLHEQTEEQVTRGAAGFIIVRDDEEAQLILPRTYGVDDFPIAVQTRAFDANKEFLWNTTEDDIVMCNGTLDPVLDVPAQVIRLRLLNGSTQRVYNLGFEDDLIFFQIATDGGLLNAPVSLKRLRLAPGERAEVLLDLSTHQGQSFSFMSFASELPNGIYGASNPSGHGSSGMMAGSISGYNNNSLNGNDFKIMQFQVSASTANPIFTIPSTLTSNTPYAEPSANNTREFYFQSPHMGPQGMLNGPFAINGQLFNLNVINHEIPLNNIEIWELVNMTAISHPFHIHDVQFYILDINGNPPPANMQGRKDVVLVPPMFGTVRFITKFEDFADENAPYMYHCHMLNHEDGGMMGQFVVVGTTTSTTKGGENSILIYPNPVANLVHVQGLPNSTIRLQNLSGQLLEERVSLGNEEQFNLAEFASGIYYFNIRNAEQNFTYKVIKYD